MLGLFPARFEVLPYEREKVTCPKCCDGIIDAPARRTSASVVPVTLPG
ncbi:hypothetical protein L6V77_32075 [Myxococcota bacterium]|nr:hypothetical protein [Myxococcota bacterium]